MRARKRRNGRYSVPFQAHVRGLILARESVADIMASTGASESYVRRQVRATQLDSAPEISESAALVNAKFSLDRAYRRFLEVQSPATHQALNDAQRAYEVARKETSHA